MIFGPNGPDGSASHRVKLGSYRETGIEPHMYIDPSRFNDFHPVTEPDQTETLTHLEMYWPDFKNPAKFPNLTKLTITRDMFIINTLSRLTCPSLLELGITDCEDEPESEDPELYLAPLLLRFPKLWRLSVDVLLSQCLLPPGASADDGSKHPTLRELNLTTASIRSWKFSSFLEVFPHLDTVAINCSWEGRNEDELGNMVVARGVTQLSIPTDAEPDLVRKASEAFPNVTTLLLHGDTTPLTWAIAIGADLLEILSGDEVGGGKNPVQAPKRWPQLQRLFINGAQGEDRFLFNLYSEG